MTKTTAPYAETELAQLLRARAAALQDEASLRAMAEALGYRSPNVLAMYLRGEARVPVERAALFAQVFGLEPGAVVRAAFRQWLSDSALLEPLLALIVSPSQRLWLDRIAAATGEADPEMSEATLRRCAQAFASGAA